MICNLQPTICARQRHDAQPLNVHHNVIVYACCVLPIHYPYVQVDPSIMGGMVVDIGDKHIDMSISARVKKIQQLVMQTI